MSRIEQALEKAVQVRKAVSAPSRAAASDRLGACDPTVFKAVKGGIEKSAVNRHIVSINDPYSSAAEEYRKLRARILKVTEKDFLNTILVTSAHAGEGKTVTAINFAVTLSQELDHTVLLVDADLRRPSIHTYLGLRPSRGLSEYLTSTIDLSDVLIKTGIGKLVFLPAGNPPENPSELMASERMRALVRELKDRYRDRYVIIDSSPLLLAADSLSLCAYVDNTLLVVKAATTEQNTAIQALSLIKGYRVLGTIFNNVPQHAGQNRYPYYYRSPSAGTEKRPAGVSGGNNGGEPKGA